MKPWLTLAAVALLLIAWLCRYEIIIGGSRSTMILQLDRWTGNLYIWEPTLGKWERFDVGPPAVDLLRKQ